MNIKLKANRFLILLLISSFLILGCAAKKEALLPPGRQVKEEAVTRGEFAHLLATRLRIEKLNRKGRRVIITDISGSPYKREIKRVAGLRIMEAYPNHAFLPEKVLNRGECAEIIEDILAIVRGAKWRKRYLGKTSSFSDVPDYHCHSRAIALATRTKIMKPYKDGTFKPGLSLSSREARRIIRKLERYFK